MTFKSHTSIFKTRRKIWCLLLDGPSSELKYGEAFSLLVPTDIDVHELKVKIKGEKPMDLAHIEAARLEVWQYLSDSEELLNTDPDNLRPLLDFSNKNTIKRVRPHHKVSSFAESGVTVLLVQVPCVSHASVLNPVTVSSGSSQQPGGYTDIFIRVSEHGKFNDVDLKANQVVKTDNNFIPSFVVDYWTKLEEKRSVNSTELEYLRGAFGDRLTLENFKSASTETQESPQQPPSFEIRHMLDMGFIKEKAWSDGHKETFANGLLFFRLQSYILNMPSNTQLESRFPKAWPYSLVIKSGEICSPYTPQSDYSIWIGVFPRLLVEVNSGNSAHGQVNPEDYTRLLLQGSSSIRLMNHIRRCKGEQKPAVLMVIYIDKECNARRLLLFQKEHSHVSSEVYYTHVTDNLQTCEGRLRLARVLYNLVDALDTDTCDSAFEESKEVVETLIALKRHAKGPAFPSKRQHATEKENETNSSKRQRQHETDQDTLKRAGYGLVPDVVENDHGTFEPWFKRPPHIYYVYQIGGTDKKEYVMKRIRHHSNEKHILQSFTTEPSCDNIIQMVEMIESSVDTFVVFPKLGSVFEALQFGGRPLCGRLVDMSRDLARGLIFLHNNNIAHLDINPSNLGFTDKYHLQIFDFDISVQVNGEDEQIDDYLGTEGWMAPEIGTRDGPRQPYSPIRADKYSCGRVFRVFADTNGGVDEDLGQFAEKLMHPNPSKRPHLLEWCGPATLTQTNSAEMDKTMVADDEAMVTEEAMVAEGTMVAEVVEDEQKVVAPKRPRVGYGGEGFHQVPM